MHDINPTTDAPKFITNQGDLAQVVGVTPQYLSMAKKHYLASDSLIQRLVKVTGILPNIWMLPRYHKLLNRQLKAFFKTEKVKKESALTTLTTDQPT